MARRLFIVTVLLITGVGAFLVTTSGGALGSDCSKDNAAPSGGSMSLTYLRPSAENDDRNDYRVDGTIRWDSADTLACFALGVRDWSYEHDLMYGVQFDRKLWNVDLSGFPADSGAYVDTTASDSGDRTTLGLGIFRPDKLEAGVDYHYSFELFLPNNPSGGRQPLTLEWEVSSRDCSRAGPWCVGLNPFEHRGRGTLIGATGDYRADGSSCWTFDWVDGQSHPTNCGAAPVPASPAVETGSPVTPSHEDAQVPEAAPAPASPPTPLVDTPSAPPGQPSVAAEQSTPPEVVLDAPTAAPGGVAEDPVESPGSGTVLIMTVSCVAPATMTVGAYGEGMVTIEVDGPVSVRGVPGDDSLVVDVPAGSYTVSGVDTPGGGAQGIWLESSSPTGYCNVV